MRDQVKILIADAELLAKFIKENSDDPEALRYADNVLRTINNL